MGADLIFALNSTMPIFILIALGFFLKKINILSDGFLSAANKLNFKVTLPVLLFVDLAETDFAETFDLKFFLFCAIVTSISFFGVWGLAKAFMKDKACIGEYVQASYRSSAAVLGLALIQNIYGSTGMAGMMMLGCVPLYNIYAVIVLQTEAPGQEKGKGRLKKALLDICRNPIIIAIVLGLVSSLIGIDYPAIIDTSLDYVGRCATPLALICIGGAFEFRSAASQLKKSALAAATKIAILPLIFVPIAILMGFETERLVAIFVMLAAPTTPSCYIMAKNYGYEGVVTSSTVVLTTLFSTLTLTIFIFTLRTLGFI